MQQQQSVTNLSESDDMTSSGSVSLNASMQGQDQRLLDRSDALRLSGSNLHSSQKLLRDLFHRMVTLEQKMRQLEISNDQVREHSSNLTQN